MTLSTRYGLVGLMALAVLTVTHWIRGREPIEVPALEYLLGVLPNTAAAVAMPFVFIAIWTDQRPAGASSTVQTSFGLAALLSCAGLIGWEFVQQDSRRLVFDIHDIGATIVGTAIAGAAFWVSTPRVDSGTPGKTRS